MKSATERSKTPIASASFLGLVATQFLGALNDNMFRWLAVPIGQRTMDPTQALVLGGVLFTLPYLMLAPLAGSLADRLSKRRVIVACKVAEIVLMALGLVAMLLSNLPCMFACVFLMGAQAALFAPAKFGALPEMLHPEDLSKGNGIMGMATVIASALGLVAGYQLYGAIKPALDQGITLAGLWIPATALLGAAVLGTLTSLLVQAEPPAAPDKRFEWNPVTETWPALKLLGADVRILRTALGIGFFWMLASLAQLNVDPFATEALRLPNEHVGILMAVLVAGLAAGSVLAGIWSQGKVELGIVPLGALGIAISGFSVYLASRFIDPAASVAHQASFYVCCFALFSLGASAGLFDVPLEAYLQHKSDDRSRGTILAGSNFVSFALILVSCVLFEVLHGILKLSPASIFMVAGLGTIPILIYVLKILPDVTARFLFWLISKIFYRMQVVGRDNIPERGGALLVANHVSWMDGILVLISSSRFVRFLVYADYANAPALKWLSDVMRVIPIKSTEGPKAIVKALKSAQEAVKNGEVVCIFAEGALTRTGQLQPFQRGLMKIVEGTNAPIIPTYLHGLWGSIFSFKFGKFFWKKPSQWPYPVSIHFGKPLAKADDVVEVRRAVEQLGVEASEMAKERELVPVRRFLRQSRRCGKRLKVADSGGVELSGKKMLASSLGFLRVLNRRLTPNVPRVGVLLPPSVGGCIANMSLALGRKVAVNLNYTLTDSQINFCIQKAGIRQVLTSKKFLEKRPFAIEGAEFVYLEDLKTQVSSVDKLLAGLGAFVTPITILERQLGLTKITPEEELTIIFTSGSTGVPKGVVLKQSNIGSNVKAVDHLLQLKPTDVLLGVLPFFHSFGYTATLWLPMCFDAAGIYHFNPLDAKIVGKLSEKYKVTLILATPTFLRTYMRRCEKEQFATLDLVVVGAEKMPLDLAEEFQQKFGFTPSEGYGTTELSPVAAVNIPDHRSLDVTQKGTKLGTVGRPIPGCAAKVVNPDTFEDLGNNHEGLLLIKGPNVMQGYLDEPGKTAEVVKDGWYVTGDFGKIDDEGFVSITGRQSRFSKIGGEMVPHIRIEEELMRIVETPGSDDPTLKVAVTSVPDHGRGEKLVVLHRPLSKTPAQIIKELSDTGLPNLWLPSKDAFYEVEQIPILGTGKLDLRAMKDTALQLTSSSGQKSEAHSVSAT